MTTSLHSAQFHNTLSVNTSDQIFNITIAIQLCTFQLHFCCCAAPCHSAAFSTQRCFSPLTSQTASCTFPGHILIPHRHHYLNPHGRCRSRQLHPPLRHHNHRHFLIHNHNPIKPHQLCPFQLPLHCPTALPPPGRLCNHPSRHRNPRNHPQCFHPPHLPLRTWCHNYILHHLQNLIPPRRSTRFQQHNKQQLLIIRPSTHSTLCPKGFGNPTQLFLQSHNLHLNLYLRRRLHWPLAIHHQLNPHHRTPRH